MACSSKHWFLMHGSVGPLGLADLGGAWLGSDMLQGLLSDQQCLGHILMLNGQNPCAEPNCRSSFKAFAFAHDPNDHRWQYCFYIAVKSYSFGERCGSRVWACNDLQQRACLNPRQFLILSLLEVRISSTFSMSASLASFIVGSGSPWDVDIQCQIDLCSGGIFLPK